MANTQDDYSLSMSINILDTNKPQTLNKTHHDLKYTRKGKETIRD